MAQRQVIRDAGQHIIPLQSDHEGEQGRGRRPCVPAGAWISAGKVGSVDRSLPTIALSGVNLSAPCLHAVTEVTGNLMMM